MGLIGSAFKAGAMFVEPLAAAIHDVAPQRAGGASSRWRLSGAVCCSPRALPGREPAIDPARLKTLLDTALAREGVFRE